MHALRRRALCVLYRYTLPVFRKGTWQTLTTDALLPGDLISLSPPSARAEAAATAASAARAAAAAATPAGTASGDAPSAGATTAVAATTPAPASAPQQLLPELIVPCDCVLLRGTNRWIPADAAAGCCGHHMIS